MLTAERLRDLLLYDHESGVFTWRVRAAQQVRVGDVAGYRRANGYRVIKIYGRLYFAHRLAWLYVHGEWPVADIDHLNGVRYDNRIANLRDVTRSVNMQNQRRATVRNKSSGLLGVCTSLGKWKARIQLAGKQRYLGTFDTSNEAHAAYLAAKREIHPGGTL